MRYEQAVPNQWVLVDRVQKRVELERMDRWVCSDLKPVIEMILTEHNAVDDQLGITQERVYTDVLAQVPRIEREDVERALVQMKLDGWARSPAHEHWTLFSRHQCVLELQLRFLFASESRQHPQFYECRICGAGWKKTVVKRLVEPCEQVNWECGLDLAWVKGTIQHAHRLEAEHANS